MSKINVDLDKRLKHTESCYTFEKLNYESGLLDSNVDVTYIIHLENSGRYDNIIKQLEKTKPTKIVYILLNKGYSKCNKVGVKNLATANVGLLDFQDALIGSPAYDFLSLLEDARRDIKFDIAKSLFQYYQENSNFDKRQFAIDYAIFSLQRNLKILGIFCRLANRDGKMQYLELLPRVFEFIKSRCLLEICPFSNIQLPMVRPLVDFLKATLSI